VQLDGQTIATRGGGVLAKFFGGGWPTASDVVAAVRARMGPKS
jgi:hypothetical protein